MSTILFKTTKRPSQAVGPTSNKRPKIDDQPTVAWKTKDIPARINALKDLDSPEALKSAIKDPALLAAYHSSEAARAEILEKVITKAIKPGAMDAALALLNCPQWEKLDERVIYCAPHVPSAKRTHKSQPRTTRWEAKVAKFLRRFKDHAFTFPTEPDDILLLFDIYYRINPVLPHLVKHFLRPSDKPSPINPSGPIPSLEDYALSDNEVGRIQRALCHYEIHCRLLDLRVTRAGVRLPSHLNNMSLPPHEGEELLHVRAYIEHQYDLCLGEHEAAFSTYLEKVARKDVAQPHLERHPARRLVGEKFEDFPYLEHFYRGLQRQEAEEQRQEDYVDLECVRGYTSRLLGFGLGFLDHFLRIPAQTRFDFFKETMWPLISIETGPKVAPWETGAPALPGPSSRASDPSWGWREMVKTGGLWQRERAGLRRYGWLFWDAERLRAMRLGGREELLAAAARRDGTYYRAKSRDDIPGLKAGFRRLFFGNRVKKEWGATITRAEGDQKMVLRWVKQIQAKEPGTTDDWALELRALRSSKSPSRPIRGERRKGIQL